MKNYHRRVGLISLFNDMSTFMGYLMPKSSLQKDHSGTIQSTAVEDKGFQILPYSMSPKVNVIVQL